MKRLRRWRLEEKLPKDLIGCLSEESFHACVYHKVETYRRQEEEVPWRDAQALVEPFSRGPLPSSTERMPRRWDSSGWDKRKEEKRGRKANTAPTETCRKGANTWFQGHRRRHSMPARRYCTTYCRSPKRRRGHSRDVETRWGAGSTCLVPASFPVTGALRPWSRAVGGA